MFLTRCLSVAENIIWNVRNFFIQPTNFTGSTNISVLYFSKHTWQPLITHVLSVSAVKLQQPDCFWVYDTNLFFCFIIASRLHDSSHSLHSASSCFWLRPVNHSRDEQDASVWTGRSAEREKHGAAVTWSHDSASQTAFSLSRRRVVTAQFWFWVQDVCSELSASNHLQSFLVSSYSPEIL